VDWWNTLHQPASIMRLDGPAIDGAMLYPLLTMILLFKLYLVTVMILRIRLHVDERKILNLRTSAADRI
ncbi:MAG: heme transporter HemC, partial [Geminicoccaceae bacterium]|nr:heme transporter HemC [Geminicoccaceae bacterium]